MRIDFYHIDGMEAPNYVPVWRELRRMGVDARLVTVPDPRNTASRGWFDFDATTDRYRQQGIDYTTEPDYDCDLAVTTQAPAILAPYRGLKARMMYGPSMLSDSFSHSRAASEAFDAVLVHGKYSQRRVARWLPEGGVLIGGHPKCDDFFLGKYEGHKAQYRSQYPGKRPIVSYLPTWAEASSLDLFLDAVAGLRDHYDVLIKPHHCTIRREPGRMARIGSCGAKVILDASELAIMYALSDLVIADVRSGAFYEAIALGVPAIAVTANAADTSKHLDPRALAAAPLCTQPADLPGIVDTMLARDQYADGRERLAGDLLSFRDGTAASHAAGELVHLVERARPRRPVAVSSPAPAPSRGRATAAAKSGRKSVVWVCLDGLRPDRLRSCGHQDRPELFIDSVIGRGRLFTHMFTAGDNTKTSSFASLTSMYGASNGVDGYDDECLKRFDPHCLTLADFLKRHGYATFRYSDMPSYSQPPSGFDVYEDSGFEKLCDTPRHSYDVPRRRAFIERFNRCSEPRFAYLHLCLLHELGAEQGGLVWTSAMYDRIIKDLDADARQVLEGLDLAPDDLLVITTDHGVDLDCNRLDRHRDEGVRLDDGHMRVFCSFVSNAWDPGVERRVVRTIDIAPTILDVAGCGPMGAQGVSLLPLFRGEPMPPLEAFMARGSTYEAIPHGASPCTWGVRTDAWKYVTHKWRPEAEWLINLEQDGDYERNLIGTGLPMENLLRQRVHDTIMEGAKPPRQIYAEHGQNFSRLDLVPTVTAIMPVERPSPGLAEAISSVLEQVGPYRELIVVDGDESGGTGRVLAAACGDHPHVRVIPAAGATLGDLLNRGLAEARGAYVTVVWPEGTYARNCFYELTNALADDPEAGVAFADWEGAPAAGRPAVRNLVPQFTKAALIQRNFLGPCVLCRTELVRRAGGFDNSQRALAWDLWKRLAEITAFRAVNRVLVTLSARPNRYLAGESAKVTVMPRTRPTVVLPTYNHLKYLPLAVESVLAQTHRDFELIIVNDGSTDGTREWLDGLTDQRITVIHQENTRLPGALNTGMRAATGELVTWISSDNWCAPTFLETMIGAFVTFPDAGFVSSAYANIDEDGRILNIHRNPDYSLHSLMSVNPGTASFMYRRSCHDEVGFYDPDLEGAEDWDMWLRIHERYKFVYVPDVLYYYRIHANSMSGLIRPKIMEKSRQTIANLYARNQNAFDIMRVYPDIARCTNKPRAAMEAIFDFGSTLLRSPFNPVDAAIKCLEESRRVSPHDRHVAINLAIAYGRAGRFDEAARVAKDALDRMAGASQDPELRTIIRASRSQDQAAFKAMPVHVLEKSRSELFRAEAAARLIYTHHSGVPVRAAAMSRSPV